MIASAEIVLAGFLACTLIQLFYYLFIFRRLAAYREKPGTQENQPVSVIVVAKNELKNLQENLPFLLQQNHPEYEVIVVNNGSWDQSKEYLEDLCASEPRLRLVQIDENEKYPKGKKFGLTLGIKAARYDLLLLTDADCVPNGDGWISSMQRSYRDRTEIVLGYSPYLKKKQLVNLFIRFETFYTGLQYLSFALAGFPYMGTGRNLSYRKDTFFRVKGFASHNHIMSGDDDLFVNEVARRHNVRINIAPESLVYSFPKENFSAWFRQKKRHLSTGRFYRTSHIIRLSILNISHILFYVLGIAALVLKADPVWIAAAFGVRLLVQLVIYYFTMKKLRELPLIWLSPLLDLLYAAYYLFMGTRALFVKHKNW